MEQNKKWVLVLLGIGQREEPNSVHGLTVLEPDSQRTPSLLVLEVPLLKQKKRLEMMFEIFRSS